MAATTRPRESLVRALRPGLELREASDSGKPILTGHFSVFNTWTRIRSSWEGDFYEMVKPGAFRKTMLENRNRMRVMLNHGNDPQLGDKPIASINELREDEVGAYYEATLFDGLPAIVLDGLRAGAYDASFRFSILQENWDDRPKRSEFNPTGLPQREIKECTVAEFGPCTFGAYPDASAGVRSLTDRFMLDALAEHPDSLRELIQDRKTRTVVAMSPNAKVTFSSRGAEVTEIPTPKKDEERMDLDDLGLLTSMAQYGQWYINGQDEDDDPANVTKMQAIIDSLAVLVKVEADEPTEPMDDEDVLFYSADPIGEAHEVSEPERSAATTPVPGSEEPEPSAATTHRNNVDLEIDLYIPNRKDEPLWRL